MTLPVAQTERPGTAFFAPGVRIQRLGSLQPGRQEGEDLPADVVADVRSVEITRVHNGASQYTIVLNNAYTSTAADRRGPPREGEQELRSRDRHVWPRYKYTAFDLLTFGQRLRIDLRYWPEESGGQPGTDGGRDNGSGRGSWVPLVAGPITDMRFTFGGSGTSLTVSGEDDLSQLKDRRTVRHEFDAVPERDLVVQLLTLAGYPLTSLAQERVDWPSFATTGDAPAEAIDDGQSYLEFLQKLADRLDLEVFVEFVDLDDPQAGVELHVEPARSAQPPQESSGAVYTVEQGKSLLSYAPRIKIVDQPSEVLVRGRHRDRERPRRVEGRADRDDVRDELHVDPALDDDLAPAADVRNHFFPDRPNPLVLSNETNLDDERGRHLALVGLRRKARELFTIDGSTIGLPRLRPGNHVEIRGLTPPFDGFFYLTKTVHSYGVSGYATSFSARRPGMPLPPYERG